LLIQSQNSKKTPENRAFFLLIRQAAPPRGAQFIFADHTSKKGKKGDGESFTLSGPLFYPSRGEKSLSYVKGAFYSPVTYQFFRQALHFQIQTQNTEYLFRDIPYLQKTVLLGSTLKDSFYIQGDLFTHHNFRDNIEHLLVAAAAACGAMCYLLYALEGFQHACKILMCIERICDVCITYLFAITNHIIFYHNITSVLISNF
jgi:hypothetical protein